MTPRKSALGAIPERIAPVPLELDRLAANVTSGDMENMVWWSNRALLRFALLRFTPARFTPRKSTLTKGMLARLALLSKDAPELWPETGS